MGSCKSTTGRGVGECSATVGTTSSTHKQTSTWDGTFIRPRVIPGNRGRAGHDRENVFSGRVPSNNRRGGYLPPAYPPIKTRTRSLFRSSVATIKPGGPRRTALVLVLWLHVRPHIGPRRRRKRGGGVSRVMSLLQFVERNPRYSRGTRPPPAPLQSA